MNTDKLMELERKWRAEAKEQCLSTDGPYKLAEVAMDVTLTNCADELAALRAEQAVGDEQRARELAGIAAWHRRMNLELSGKGSEWAAKEMYACRHGKFAETLERALGAARQSDALKGWRVIPFAGDRTGDERWEVYDENGSGGAIYLSDIGAGIVRSLLDRLAAARQSEGVVEYEFEVWQGDDMQAGGTTATLEAAQAEAGHYALMYGQDGEVELKFYERRAIAAAAPGGEGEVGK